MIDYLKGSIVKFKFNFQNILENKCELIWQWQVLITILVCFHWGYLTLVNNLYFQISPNQIISVYLDLFPKNSNGFYLAPFDEVYSWN